MSQAQLLADTVRALDSYHFDDLHAQIALEQRAMFSLLDTRSGDKVDFWPLTDQPFDVRRFERRIPVHVFGLDLFVSTPEDTILQKLRWAEASGGSERQFNDALGVYEVHAGALDEEYLDRWAALLGVAGPLADIRAAARL